MADRINAPIHSVWCTCHLCVAWVNRQKGAGWNTADPTPNEPDLRGRDRDEWRHQAAEWQRLK